MAALYVLAKSFRGLSLRDGSFYARTSRRMAFVAFPLTAGLKCRSRPAVPSPPRPRVWRSCHRLLRSPLAPAGETLTLIMTEAGGFARNGEAFAHGPDVMGEAKGSTYALTLGGTT